MCLKIPSLFSVKIITKNSYLALEKLKYYHLVIFSPPKYPSLIGNNSLTKFKI